MQKFAKIKEFFYLLAVSCVMFPTIFGSKVYAEDDAVRRETGAIELDTVDESSFFVRIKGAPAQMLFDALAAMQPVKAARYCKLGGQVTHWLTVVGEDYVCRETSVITSARLPDETVSESYVTCYLTISGATGQAHVWPLPNDCQGSTGIAGVRN